MNKFIPKNYKYKKIHKKVYIKNSIYQKSNYLKKNSFGLKILTNGLLSSIILEASRKTIRKKLKKIGNIKINIFPNIPLTKKSSGIRMGKGIGNISKWVCPLKKGIILFELTNVSLNTAKIALKAASYKLPVKSKFIYVK